MHVQIKPLIRGRSLNVCLVVPPRFQGLISQEMPTQAKEHEERSEEKMKMIKKFNKRKSLAK